MSGHSKWSTIKRAKAKNDATTAKLFTKILRELTVAVKEGGPDPNSNTRLKGVMLKARTNNMSNDVILRTIKKASGEIGSVNYFTITYEGYGPAGSAIIVDALTDNKNRTAGDVRHLFDKHGGNLGTTGSVSYLFSKVGHVIVLKNANISDDDIVMHALEAGAQDVEINESFYKIITTPEEFENVKQYLEINNIDIEDAMLELLPSNYVELSEDNLKSFNKLIDALEDNDDVQEVYHNVNLPEELED